MTLPARIHRPLTREAGRPVSRRTRTFRPNYLSLAGTYQCNLTCPHCCVPIEWPDRLEIAAALRFLDDAHEYGINILGLSGGEPFLYPEFIQAVCRRASELGFRFDKIMTNGVWFQDLPHLEDLLGQLANTGFTGKLGLSVDKFHGVQTGRLADFCRTARRVFRRDNIVSISYASRAPDQGLGLLDALARELEGVVEWSDLLNRYLLVTPELTMTLNWNHLAPVERAERLGGQPACLPDPACHSERSEESPRSRPFAALRVTTPSAPGNPWDGVWFAEDYCEGPGQALVINPRGDVKPCCGFASDLDQLTIGNIYRDRVRQIVRRARRHPYVGKVFRKGLTAIREEILARDPSALLGATSNHCYFCWYVLTRGLASGVNGGGGQVGNWTGPRPNYTGELIQIGLRQ